MRWDSVVGGGLRWELAGDGAGDLPGVVPEFGRKRADEVQRGEPVESCPYARLVPERGGEEAVALRGDGGQQAARIAEVVRGRCVRDADAAREVPQPAG